MRVIVKPHESVRRRFRRIAVAGLFARVATHRAADTSKARLVEHRLDANPKAESTADSNIANERVVGVCDPKARRLVVERLQPQTGMMIGTAFKLKITRRIVLTALANSNRINREILVKNIEFFSAIYYGGG